MKGRIESSTPRVTCKDSRDELKEVDELVSVLVPHTVGEKVGTLLEISKKRSINK